LLPVLFLIVLMFGLYSPPPFIMFVILTDPRVAGE
jgi:hypothetical protein